MATRERVGCALNVLWRVVYVADLRVDDSDGEGREGEQAERACGGDSWMTSP